jgi:dolichol-phosphate mannosyltransferase
MTLSIIIPTYNEKSTILEILRKIEQVDLSDFSFDKEIIIVDDCSTDGTRDILDKLTAKYKIIHHQKNAGKGAAIKTGLKYVSGDYVIIQDADLEYDPEDYRIILGYALKNKAKVVYGSRQRGVKKVSSSLSYYLGGVFLTFVTNFLYGTKITDESTCYKFFETETIKSIPLKYNRFEFCPEVTAKIAKKGIKIHEVPISYTPRRKKEGKKIKWEDGVKALFVLIRYRFF